MRWAVFLLSSRQALDDFFKLVIWPGAILKRDSLLDGWRGVSVLCVIIGHFVGHRFASSFQQTPFRRFLEEGLTSGNIDAFVTNIAARLLAPIPALGVDVFFMTSGYLITTLLLKEERDNGGVSVKAFYIRRVFRILPAFYAYLATIVGLAWFGWVEASARDVAFAGSFLCSLPDAACGWFVGHSWSLSVEEQFYLLFPLAFIALARWRVPLLCLTLGALTALYFPFPRALSFAHILLGALIATSPRARAGLLRVARPGAIVAAALIVLAQAFLDATPIYPILNAFRPLLIAVIFFGTLNGVGPFVRLVEISAFQKVGLVSYSLYLWQQLSTAEPALYANFSAGLSPLLFVFPALVSYRFIEQPMVRIGRRFSAAATERSASARRARAQSPVVPAGSS